MFISMNWIKDFVDLKDDEILPLINKFTLKTAEVEGIEEKGKDTKGIVIAQIKSVENHPDSDHLHLLKVDAGQNELVDIVCGAPNVRVGMKTALATEGGYVQGHKITAAKLRGYVSHGMCCSGKELGVSDDHSGILDLETDLPNGTDINELIPINDIIFEVDNKSLTNRPDLWCHYGIARELASHANKPLKPLTKVDLDVYNNLEEVKIEVNCENLLRYTAIKINNITQKHTPYYMQTRLFYCGMRSINLLADLTNYIMLEIGQPMHAFDGDKVTQIEVENAKEGEEFVTLDGQTRILSQNDIMIKSKGENVCIGGVMGGLDSEIVDDSKNLLLESATFDCASIRKTANRLGLRSEASNRYEKSLDPVTTKIATARFIKLLQEIDEKIEVVSKFSDKFPKPYPEIKIEIELDYINSYIGVELTSEFVKNTLESIDFKVEMKDEKTFQVLVPSFRATKDVSIKADLVEEIARLYGYDNIVSKPLSFDISAQELDPQIKHTYEIKDILASNGLTEIYSYIWKDKKQNEKLNIVEKTGLKVTNSALFDEIRTELLPTILSCVDQNVKNYADIKIFEIAHVADGIVDGVANERVKLAIAIASQQKDEKTIYFEAKKLLEIISKKYNLNIEYQTKTVEKSYVHPFNNAKILIDNEEIGLIGLVHPKTTKSMDSKIKVAVVEVDMNLLLSKTNSKAKYNPISIYQPVNLDLNFLQDKNKDYSNIEKVLKSFKTDLDMEIALKDIYTDQSLGNQISYTFAIKIVSYEHTLTSEEINKFIEDIVAFAKQYDIILRS